VLRSHTTNGLRDIYPILDRMPQDCATSEHICRYDLISIYAVQPSRLKGGLAKGLTKWKKCDSLAGQEEETLSN
jgi:hypothetical protein